MELKEYYNNKAVSQSQLKLLLGSDPSIFITIQEPDLYFEEKKHFLIGDAVDTQLTRPIEVFKEKFHTSNVQNKPSDTIKSIINQVLDRVKENFSQDIGEITNYPDVILQCCNEHEYSKGWKDETRISKICESWEYWEDLKKAIGKQVLSQEENDIVSQIVMSIRTSPTTSYYFQEEKNKEIIYQLPIFFKYLNVDCKALLDMVIIDHINKTIQPIDIKTMGDQTMYFSKSLRQRRYDIQAAFYTEALKFYTEYSGYTILPFKFIVESTTTPGIPLVYTCASSLLNIGKYGRPEILLEGQTYPDRDNKCYARLESIKGFHQLIEDYLFYVEFGFDRNKKIVENNGEFKLDWSGIIF